MSTALPAWLDVALIRAPNPGPLTLSGTNSWIVGRDPAWLIDPGPALEAHLDALAGELDRRGGIGGIALTHSHGDHSDGVAAMLARVGSRLPVGAAAGAASPRLVDGDRFGPLEVLSLPGHAPDHLGFVLRRERGSACFTGDAVLGEGSVFVSSDMAGYLRALVRLRDLAPDLLCPGHGPPVTEVAAHLDGYLAHRLEREHRLLVALRSGVRDEDALLAAAWTEVPDGLREPARLSLRAHLAKLADEGRLPV